MARIHHLGCGTMCPIGGRLVGGDRWLARARLVCHCLLVETDKDGLVLVETGFGTADCEDPNRLPRVFRAVAGPRLDRSETALEQVRALGFDPRDVRHVVVTHLDPDHAGGLPDFPWATVHVHRFERDDAVSPPDVRARTRYWKNRFAHHPRWAVYEPKGDVWMDLPAVKQLDGLHHDLALVPMIGHTRGHTAVVVRHGARWLVHAGDAYFHRDELADPPRAPIALRWFATMDEIDRDARLASVAALRRLKAHPDVDVVCAHDPVELDHAAAASAP
ncbi:MAG TPA: MBL fold metallo-hydrolase, partial [Kofleriaceae bacterium]|nr:MBL fold metallo-hydrolase [Kofleriaceae bacterium]